MVSSVLKFRQIIRILIAVLILVILYGLGSSLSKISKNAESGTNPQDSKKEYTQFINKYKDSDIKTQHMAAHSFGQLLYDRLGVNGILVCDQSYSFGCYHGFFIKAVSKEGLPILPKLDNACGNSLGCKHGIGHGILVYLGTDKLIEALGECANLSWQGKLFGCQEGVFMEYNFPLTNHDPSTAKARPYNSDNPYSPCESVPLTFKQACYYSLPQWWGEYSSDFKKFGELCDNLERENYKRACFLGMSEAIGRIVPQLDNSIVKQKCSLMPNKFGVEYCTLKLVWVIGESAAPLCYGFSSDFEKLCLDPEGQIKLAMEN